MKDTSPVACIIFLIILIYKLKVFYEGVFKYVPFLTSLIQLFKETRGAAYLLIEN